MSKQINYEYYTIDIDEKFVMYLLNHQQHV
jgi:hypothetical protein